MESKGNISESTYFIVGVKCKTFLFKDLASYWKTEENWIILQCRKYAGFAQV